MMTVTFEKVVGGGRALGYAEGRAVFAAGPLPGETAEVEVTKTKSGYVEAQVTRIVRAAAQRGEAAEEHFLACAPWQGVEYDYQLELKRQVLAEAFGHPDLLVPVAEMVAAPALLGYRNKLEFSIARAGAAMDLGFHARGSYGDIIPLPHGCRLGSEAMNAAALGLLERVREFGLSESLDTLTVRQSVATGAVLGHVALLDKPRRRWAELEVPGLEVLVVSRRVGRSQHELLGSSGAPELTDRVAGIDLTYPYDGFFQTNVPFFEQIAERIVAAVPPRGRLVDLYGGVGTLGLAAARVAGEVLGVEINPGSVEAARANAARVGIANYAAVATSVAGLDARLLDGADCVIVDPPRAGLEPAVVRAIVAAAPRRIIYLSCNPATQARDMRLLQPDYRAAAVTGFDLYPGTLHLESLAILERV
ncbi:MAG TPA: TRAM domain-containing protein [Candidatus Saccharimonadia bacterium]|nr:TRAM domain-containing protein [Candidatus Saccharimonadia bacterium]